MYSLNRDGKGEGVVLGSLHPWNSSHTKSTGNLVIQKASKAKGRPPVTEKGIQIKWQRVRGRGEGVVFGIICILGTVLMGNAIGELVTQKASNSKGGKGRPSVTLTAFRENGKETGRWTVGQARGR